MPDQDRPVNLQRCNHRQDVVTQSVSSVVCAGWRRDSEDSGPAASNTIDTERGGEFGSKPVEAVGGVVSPSEEDQRPTGAAPIDDLELDVILDTNKSCGTFDPSPGRFIRGPLQVERESRSLVQGSLERNLTLAQHFVIGSAKLCRKQS